MKLIEGASLARRMERGEYRLAMADQSKAQIRQAQERLVHLVATIARAVHYAHQQGVLHRDVKPANILIDEEGQPHLTDFGLAKLAGSSLGLSQTGGLLGTLRYMAPEQVTAGRVSPSTDIYSLGALLYELLTGQTPFDAATPAEILHQTAEQPAARPSKLNRTIDHDLDTICLKCLEKDPQRRYATASHLADDLERWEQHQNILALPIGPLQRTARWVGRNTLGAFLILSLLIGFLVTLILLKVASSERERAAKLEQVVWSNLGVGDFWATPNSSVVIQSETLHLTSKHALASPGSGKLERYRIGMLLEEDPINVIIGYAHLLDHLERTVSKSLGYTVRFDLRVYHDLHEAGIDALVNNDVDIFKIGGASYIAARERDPKIRPIVGQQPVKNGVIFSRKGSGVQNLQDLNDKTIAVGQPKSTVALMGKAYLHSKGVVSAHYRTAVQRSATNHGKREKTTDASQILEAVVSGADAGIESESIFRRHKTADREFVVLAAFPSSPVYWLASGALPPAIETAIRDAMLSLRDRDFFKSLGDKVGSYSIVTAQELEALRNASADVRKEQGSE
jgi:ABC-type phosphate/phosphonate transport system substrate-binding protein